MVRTLPLWRTVVRRHQRLSSASTCSAVLFDWPRRVVGAWVPRIRDSMRRMGVLLSLKVVAVGAASSVGEGDIPSPLSLPGSTPGLDTAPEKNPPGGGRRAGRSGKEEGRRNKETRDHGLGGHDPG